ARISRLAQETRAHHFDLMRRELPVPGAVRASVHLVGEERHLLVVHLNSRVRRRRDPRGGRRMRSAGWSETQVSVILSHRAFTDARPAEHIAAADGCKRRMRYLTYRPDIDGLRAIAVAIVVAFHAGVPGFTGGFVGVDVFFVISGFLITGLLVNELHDTGSISLSRFYARRVRRLLPALAVVLISTLLLGSVVLLSVAGEQQELAKSALAAALS